MKIRKLPSNIINLIAAGEIVERPASVIKELVENSIDAKATQIDIYLEESGKNLIEVSDNGHGIAKDDLQPCVDRHTTSKIMEDDIINILTFGFRGEALPSIASVSHMYITSKFIKSENAYTFDITNNTINKCIFNQGTKIQIKNLFYTLPVRLKFLKSNQVELGLIINIIKKLAISHPHITFSLSNNNKEVLKFHKADNKLNRINEILGNNFKSNALPINAKDDLVNIYGWVSVPTYCKATSYDQYFFVNQRPITNKVINIALKIAYQGLIMPNRFPIVAIFMDIDPILVDVNVHPAKTEVKFKDDTLIKDLLVKAIQKSLATSQNSVITTNNINDKVFKESIKENIKNNITHQPEPPPSQQQKSFIEKPFSNQSAQYKFADISPVSKVIHSDENEVKNYGLGAACAQIHKKYVISQNIDGMIIVDQHAAHERIVYERIKNQLNHQGVVRQKLLITEIISLSEMQITSLINHKDTIKKLGINFEINDKNSVIIFDIPSLLGNINVRQLIQDIADELIEMNHIISLPEIKDHIIQTMACHNSIRSGRKLSGDEMNELLRTMEKTPNFAQCCHGRPTYIKLILSDIDKLFKRK